MSHPLTRVLTLLELLQSHARLAGPELADRLGTDVRTVRRYAAHLRELGIPVEAERGRHGGYRLARGYRMPPLMLTNDEALAVVVGLLAAERLGMSMTTPANSGALAKIERVLPHSLREPLAAMRETLSFTANAVTAQAPETGVLLTLAQASRARTTVGISYLSWRQDQTERDLDPYGVVFHRGRWYVVGRDHRHDSLRTFRIDRIASVTARRQTFTAPGSASTLARAVDSTNYSGPGFCSNRDAVFGGTCAATVGCPATRVAFPVADVATVATPTLPLSPPFHPVYQP